MGDRLTTAISFCLACLLLFTGVHHFQNLYATWSAVVNYRILPVFLSHTATLFLMVSSLVTAALLVERETRRFGGLFSVLIFVVFSIAQISALTRGLDISCGCFGASRSSPISALSASVPIACTCGGLFVAYTKRTDDY